MSNDGLEMTADVCNGPLLPAQAGEPVVRLLLHTKVQKASLALAVVLYSMKK